MTENSLQSIRNKLIKNGKIKIISFVIIMIAIVIIPFIFTLLGLTNSGSGTARNIYQHIVISSFRDLILLFFLYFTWKGKYWARIVLSVILTIGSLIIGIVTVISSSEITKYEISHIIPVGFILFGLYFSFQLIFAQDVRLFFDCQRDKKLKADRPNRAYRYDVAISFAGEDRKIAEKLSEMLIDKGCSVFYDKMEQHNLLGKNLYQYFQKIYRDQARYAIILVSENYINKPWSMHELEQIQSRIFVNRVGNQEEYLLPIRIDDVEVPGLNDTTGYLDCRQNSISKIAEIIFEKILLSEN